MEVVLPKSEQIPNDTYKEGDVIRLFIVEVADTERGPHLVVSRTHPGLVKRLFELEVPEIFNGTVEIVSVAREAGSRTKMAVSTSHADVDARGACIGMQQALQVSSVVDELCGEKIDVVLYSEDPKNISQRHCRQQMSQL